MSSAGKEKLVDGKVKAPFCPPDVEWKTDSPTSPPEGIILSGKYNGANVYTGRAYYEGELLIGTVKEGICIVAKDGKAHETKEYKVMTVPVGEPLIWEPVSPGHEYPEDIIFAGKLKDGQSLNIGRVVKDGNTSIGWVDQNKCLHAVQDGKEKTFTEFEIVVHRFLKFLAICPPCPPDRHFAGPPSSV